MRSKGFTLLEVMTTTAVVAVLGAIAVPAMQEAIHGHRAREAVTAFTRSAALARITAVARNVPVHVCPSRDGIHCSDTTDWSSGWLVFPDVDGTGRPVADGPIESVQRAPAAVTLTSSTGRRRIVFQPTGWSSGTNLTLTACVAGRGRAKVVLNNAGRTRVERAGVRCTG